MPVLQTKQNISEFTDSFVSRLKQSSDGEAVEVVLVQGDNQQNSRCYAYIAIVASLIRDLEISLKIRTTNLEDFGVILISGSGSPDNATQAHITERYLK